MAFIIKPLVTEKMTKITDKQPNRYGFVVRPEADKLQIKKEVNMQVQPASLAVRRVAVALVAVTSILRCS